MYIMVIMNIHYSIALGNKTTTYTLNINRTRSISIYCIPTPLTNKLFNFVYWNVDTKFIHNEHNIVGLTNIIRT